jgi:hypothetical protein
MVDRILVLGDGVVQEAGTYSDLSNNPDSLFTRSLQSFNDSPREDEVPKTGNLDLISSTSSSSINALGIIGDDPDVAKIVAPFDGIKPPRARLGPRRYSLGSKQQPSELDDINNGELTTDELLERDIGHVTLSVYLSWARAAGGTFVFLVILVSYAAVEVINVLSRWWLTHWSFHSGESNTQLSYLFVYAVISFSSVVASFFRLLFITICGVRASRTVSRCLPFALCPIYMLAAVLYHSYTLICLPLYVSSFLACWTQFSERLCRSLIPLQ